MLYRTLKRMIQRGQTAGMAEKLDIFYAADKLTQAEYTELLGLLEGAAPALPAASAAAGSGERGARLRW